MLSKYSELASALMWMYGLNKKHPGEETGILKDVIKSSIEPADRCFLYIDVGGATYIGCLLIDDPAFCRQIVDLLLANRDRPIAEIGGLDISHLG